MQIQIVFIYLFEKQANTDCDSVSLKQQKYLPIKLLGKIFSKKKKKKKKKLVQKISLGHGTWGSHKNFQGFPRLLSLVWNPPVHDF